MRQMPSVTVTTVPWLRTSDASERFWILLRIRSLISDGFNCCIGAPGGFSITSSLEAGCRGCELAAHRVVYHFVAGGDAHAADQLLVQGDARLHPALQAPRDVRDETVDLRVVKRKGGADLGFDDALALVFQLDELPVYL